MSHHSHELEHDSFQQWWSRGPFPSGWVHPSPRALHCQWQEPERVQRILWNCKMCGVHQIRCKVPEGEAQCIIKFPQILIVISVIYFCPNSPLSWWVLEDHYSPPFLLRLPCSSLISCCVMQQKWRHCWVKRQEQVSLFWEILHTEGCPLVYLQQSTAMLNTFVLLSLVAVVWMRWRQNMCKPTASFISDLVVSRSRHY